MVERLIFKFIWTKNWDKMKVMERISRKVMKNEYKEGGLKAPDIECLDRALKLKQFIRANRSRHPIKGIQEVSLSKIGFENVIKQEYDRLNNEDWIIRIGQETINTLTDWSRKEGYGNEDNGQSSTIAINTVGSIDISTYLKRKNESLVECLFKSIRKEGIECLNDLLVEEEITMDNLKLQRLQNIKKRFPNNILKIGEKYNDEFNNKRGELTHFYMGEDKFIPVEDMTVKILQIILKKALEKVAIVEYERKLEIRNFDRESIIDIRQGVSNVKLRNVFYRLINKDFFTKERMFKFKMIDNDKCERCGMKETTIHLLWECAETKKMWDGFNKLLEESGLDNLKIKEYDDVYTFKGNGAASSVKLKIINEQIQISRPINLDYDKVKRITKTLLNTEKYIAIKNKGEIKFKKRWKFFINN
jgi:hypothetical protein